MAFDPILLAPRADAARRGGFWPDRNLLDDLAARLTETPDREALIAYRSESGRRESYTYRDLDRMARRLAGALARRGVGRGDVISAQLPNWPEFVLLYLASLHLGATLNPLMPIFRARELRFMLAHAESKVLVIPSRFRSFDYRAMIAEVRPDLRPSPMSWRWKAERRMSSARCSPRKAKPLLSRPLPPMRSPNSSTPRAPRASPKG